MTRLYPSACELIASYQSTTGEKLSVPINLEKIAEFLGIKIKDDLRLERDDIIGEISFEKEYPVISINPQRNAYPPDRRFTLAHEIGHLCLHKDNVTLGFMDNCETMNIIRSLFNPKESEANHFAAQLLMPKDLIVEEGKAIISEWQALNHSKLMPDREFIQEIAYKFSVSIKTMERRLKDIGIIK